MKKVLVIILIIFLNSCSSYKVNNQLFEADEKICLVLSVGSEKGIAHFGAIDALKELNIDIKYIYGNSAGSLVGGMYAFNPNVNFETDSKKIINTYFNKTKKEKVNNTIFNTLFSMILTGGVLGWENLFFGGLSYANVKKIDFDRFHQVIDEYFNYSDIDDTKILFATSYMDINKGIVIKNNGSLASAISKSCNNPFIFKEISNEFDPAADRLSVTPIEDAYNHFNPDKIIAINVSQSPAYYSEQIKAKIFEIPIELNEYDLNDKKNQENIKSIYNEYYSKGFNTVMEYFNQ
ncbi:MAG: hypothetical protein CMG07_05150 [Candidatus Marinimicrobia bacterium]|nr:hypothetical protein [Candidatus Neomarinimicrobiota bacterium]|tara:strand:+ start:58 stop:933 length:876 start_codon:yes stop_codon:yes gene_type:complete